MIDRHRDNAIVTCPVEHSGRNDWGLFGVGGNVWECTLRNDWLTEFDAWRGACWGDGSQVRLRCDSRGDSRAPTRYNGLSGFRLLLSRPGPE